MESVVVVDSNIDFDEKGSSKVLGDLKTHTDNIRNTFIDIDFVMDAINGDFPVWKGASQESFYNSYKSISKSFAKIIENLDDKNSFLKTTIENYEKAEKKINSNIEEKSEELDIN
jgi:uncharacterized protein YukE